MPLPETRQELLDKLETAYRQLDMEFDDISEFDGQIKHLEGLTSPADQIAHQLGWGECLLRWDATEESGRAPDMPATGYKWSEIRQLADSFYDEWRGTSLTDLRAEFAALRDRIREWIASLSDDELFSIGARDWAGDKWPIVKWIQVNTIAPYAAARTKIRGWKRERS